MLTKKGAGSSSSANLTPDSKLKPLKNEYEEYGINHFENDEKI